MGLPLVSRDHTLRTTNLGLSLRKMKSMRYPMGNSMLSHLSKVQTNKAEVHLFI